MAWTSAEFRKNRSFRSCSDGSSLQSQPCDRLSRTYSSYNLGTWVAAIAPEPARNVPAITNDTTTDLRTAITGSCSRASGPVSPGYEMRAQPRPTHHPPTGTTGRRVAFSDL